ncbi:hypothetical protein RIF29_40280 [Crotalaria pallida]|uniref:Uncharacterized protein n=1 Tax=Crotalaria pallida TaxID=3830 RepID=A0AAN9E2X0_CROPI
MNATSLHKHLQDMQVANNIEVPSRVDGCKCKRRCTTTCACVILNGSEPYVAQDGGRLIEARDVVFECGPLCKCGPNCGNRVSKQGIKHKLQVFRTPNKGWGVKTLERILAGTPVCEYIGVLRRAKEVQQDTDNSYIFEIDCKQTIDGLDGRQRRSGHVALPTCSLGDNDRAEIEPEFSIDGSSFGNELTYDYAYQLDSVTGPDGNIIQMPCHCGAATCRQRFY